MRRVILLVLISLSFIRVNAQLDSIRYRVEAATSISTNDKLPFWLVSNKNGIVPEKRSEYLYLNLFKGYSNLKTFDYSFGIDAATSAQYSKHTLINQFYASVKYSKIELLFGSKNPEVLYDGLSFVDNSIIMAGNARSYPKLQIGSLGYLEVPFTNGYLSVKGVFSNGWMLDDRYVKDVMLHHKNAYLRIGKDKGFSFEIGVEHYAQWGGTSPNPKIGKMPNNLDAFLRVLVAKEGGNYVNDAENALGNHVGQNQIRFNYETSDYDISFYMRNMYEDRSQYFLKMFYLKGIKDLRDVNYGLYIKLNKSKIVKSFLLEYYSTLYQGHIASHSAGTVVGYDSNFNNGIYASGWSNFKRGFGIPLISPTIISSNGSILFANNALRAFHLGIQGEILGLNYKFKSTIHMNYGSISDKHAGMPMEDWMEDTRIYSIDPAQVQQYYQLDILLPEGKLPFDVSASIGLDIGDMYDDNLGLMITLSKTGLLNNLFGR